MFNIVVHTSLYFTKNLLLL